MSGGKLKPIENNLIKNEKYFKGTPEITFFRKVYNFNFLVYLKLILKLNI